MLVSAVGSVGLEEPLVFVVEPVEPVEPVELVELVLLVELDVVVGEVEVAFGSSLPEQAAIIIVPERSPVSIAAIFMVFPRRVVVPRHSRTV